MPAEPVRVEPRDVERERAASRAAIREAGLPDAVLQAAPGPYGLSRTGLDVLEALEAALAAGRAAQAALLARIAAERAQGFAGGAPTDPERRFAAALGVAVACDEALAATAGTSEAPLPDRPFPAEDVRALWEAGDIAAALSRDLGGYLAHYANHADAARRLGDGERLAACVRSHWAKMALSAREAAEAPDHAAARAALERAPLRLPAADYAGLARLAARDEPETELLDVTPDDVVGNAEVLEAGLRLARAVAAYDPAEGRNPRAVDNPVLFVLGSPGCGKTITAHAVGRAFLGYCAEAGIPGRFRVIRRTDWASHYQNKSASDLLRIFRDEVFAFRGACGVYWPDIDTAFAARTDPDIRAEEKANLATLFGLLDGTIGPRNGQWFLVCDANYMQMDEAMASRLTQDPKLARGPETVEQYVRLLRDVKLRGWTEHLPPDAEWGALGERLCAARLSGRAVAAIAGRVAADLQDVPEPPGFLRLSFAEKQQALRTAARPVTAARILEHVERYVAFDQEAAARAHREQFTRRVEEIRLQLAAHAAALGPRGVGP